MHKSINIAGLQRYRRKQNDSLGRFPRKYLRDEVIKIVVASKWGNLRYEVESSLLLDNSISAPMVDLLFPDIRTVLLVQPICSNLKQEQEFSDLETVIRNEGYRVRRVHAKEILLSPDELKDDIFHFLLNAVKKRVPARFAKKMLTPR